MMAIPSHALGVGPKQAGAEHDPATLEVHPVAEVLLKTLQHRVQPVRGSREDDVELISQHAPAGAQHVLDRQPQRSATS